jgi:hypothetical protein
MYNIPELNLQEEEPKNITKIIYYFQENFIIKTRDAINTPRSTLTITEEYASLICISVLQQTKK